VISVVAILIILAAVTGSAIMTGTLMMLWQRVRRLEASTGTDRSIESASQRIDLLLDQIQEMTDGLEELRERLDFTERLLAEGTDPDERDASG